MIRRLLALVIGTILLILLTNADYHLGYAYTSGLIIGVMLAL